MSTAFFQMVRKMDANHVESRLAMQCAPVLAGVKISNLLTLRAVDAAAVEEMFRGTPIEVSVLCETGDAAVLLLYRSEAFKAYLNRDENKSWLMNLGYEPDHTQELLKEFSKRYTSYRRYGGAFPHEMGILLGYPLEDVRGFIEHEGKEFLYSGYWKVYQNPAETVRVFELYDIVREIAVGMVAAKKNIMGLMDLYMTDSRNQIAV